jgi:hypothetical protein
MFAHLAPMRSHEIHSSNTGTGGPQGAYGDGDTITIIFNTNVSRQDPD